MTHRPHHVSALLVALFATIALALALAPPDAGARSYWVSLEAADGEIAEGVNGFTWLTYGGSWNTYGSHCDARTGVRFVAGAYCTLRFNVPSGLTAGGSGAGGGGDVYGRYRVATEGFYVRTSRPGANPSYVSDETRQVSTHGGFHHGWAQLGSYIETSLTTSQIANTAGTTNTWFDYDVFTVLLDDNSSPENSVAHVDGKRAGWNGPGCSTATYGWTDTGSQLWEMNLVDLASGGVVHSWAANPGRDVVTSGVPALSAAPCISSATSGQRMFRSTARDMAGNVSTHDIEVYFDVTQPDIGTPTTSMGAINDGHLFNSNQDRPVITVPIGDRHSGIESATATFAGAALPAHYDGTQLIITPTAQLPLGSHRLEVRVVDRVGLSRTVTRNVTVRDTQAPIIRQVQPFLRGSASPVIDISARDDRGSIKHATWRLKVDGEPLTLRNPASDDIEQPLGRLVDGTHTIEISVTDAVGNVGRLTLTHETDVSPALPQLTGSQLTGIFIYDKPTTSLPGAAHRVKAIMVYHGRPVIGRAELRSGNATVGFREVGEDGTVDIAVTINATYTEFGLFAPDGLGLDAAHFAVDCPRCATDDARPVQPSVDGAGNGTVGPTSNSPQPVTPSQASALGLPSSAAMTSAAAACAAAPAACVGGYPRNVIYYVSGVPYWNGIPLAESGASLDKVAPQWKLTPVKRRAGTTKKSRSIALRLWTNEFSVMSITPTGAKRITSVGVRRKSRTILVKYTASSALGKRIAKARSGSVLTVKLRVVATDRNANASKPRVVSIRVTV